MTHMYFSARTEGRISYGHLGRTNSCFTKAAALACFIERTEITFKLKSLINVSGGCSICWLGDLRVVIRKVWKPSITGIWYRIITRGSADADNRLDAFSRQSRSTNMVPFHMLHIFLLCNSNFVFYGIRLQKISWPWNGGQRSLKVIESGIIR